MNFKIDKASRMNGIPIDYEWEKDEIEFNSLESLMKFIEENGKVIIYPDGEIVIYDSYVE